MKTQVLSILSATASVLFLSINSFAVIPAMKIKSHPSEMKIFAEEEKPLEIESWMIDESNWQYEKESISSECLSIEPWMSDENLWTKKTLETEKKEIFDEKDQKLSIEPWMMDEKVWQPKKAKS
jgi:hypothetical protein